MNITTTDITEDISKEINEIEKELPDEVLNVDKPIDKPTKKTKASQPVEKIDTLTETPKEPITWMSQLFTMDIIEDVFDRAGLTMILLGESARGMADADNPFLYSPDKFHVALRNNDRAHFERTLHSMADAWREKVTYEDDHLEFERNGVKIIVEYVDQTAAPYYNFPDKRLYQLREVALPNPYPAYIQEFNNK